MLTTAPKKSRKAKKVAPDVQEQKPKALTKKVPPTAASAEPAVERPKKRCDTLQGCSALVVWRNQCST